MNKKIATLILGISTTLAVSAGVSFAWLYNISADIDMDASGEIVTSYFHCGSGAEDDPYVITRPVHLYNLTRLYEDLDGFAEENNYFQLGYDLDNDGDLEFYSYSDSGTYQNSYSNKLNMSYYDAFTPIGSEEKPFGGTFNGSNLTLDNLNISGAGLSDIGVFGYVTEDATIQDLYIDNLDINVSGAVSNMHDVHDTNAYVGYIVGHLENANCITNTYVNNCHISGKSCLIKNDWGYYGKCDNAGTLKDFLAHAGADDPSWGGSVNMQKMYDRLYDIAGDATRNNNYVYEQDEITTLNNTKTRRTRTSGRAYTYRNRTEGSFVFSAYGENNSATGNYLYISGGKHIYNYHQAEVMHNDGFTIYDNGHYLGINNGTISDVATTWYLDEDDRLTATVNGITYYLTNNVTLSTNTTNTWTRNNRTIYYNSGGWFSRDYYLYCNNNGNWTTQRNSHNLTLTAATYTSVDEISDNTSYMDYSGDEVTYFPLVTEDNSYAASGKNTGYVIGGTQDKTTSATYPYKTGDIRVSKYSTSDISNSYSGGNFTTIYTINSNLQTTTVNAADYEKFLDSRAAFKDMITGGNIYGLHFMSANISVDHLVNADYTLINGEEKTNYKMPASSIDFNLMEKGYINFFAGTYFSNNNSFFSLHHIERDENDAITSIKEIAEIYESNDSRKDYIYKYSDNTYTDTLTSDYSLVFSTDRIKRQNSINTKSVYYFEIPVNAGEFALGSVDGGTGAYLMYLDIATNGGVDFDADVDTFGSVEYRTVPDVAETSILLITYEQQATDNVTLQVVYIESEKRYNITYSGSLEQIIVTVLSVDYKVYFNGTMLPQQVQSNYLN